MVWLRIVRVVQFGVGVGATTHPIERIIGCVVLIRTRVHTVNDSIDQESSLVWVVLVIVDCRLAHCHLRLGVLDEIVHAQELHDISLQLFVGLGSIGQRPLRGISCLGIAIVKLVSHLVDSIQGCHSIAKVRVQKHLLAAGTAWL